MFPQASMKLQQRLVILEQLYMKLIKELFINLITLRDDDGFVDSSLVWRMLDLGLN